MVNKPLDDEQELPQFNVYEQTDSALLALPVGTSPETDDEPIWSGEAENERDAIARVRKSMPEFKDAPVAIPEHDPDADDLRELAEDETNERLGIDEEEKPKKKATKKKTAAKKNVAKKAVKPVAKKTVASKTASRKAVKKTAKSAVTRKQPF